MADQLNRRGFLKGLLASTAIALLPFPALITEWREIKLTPNGPIVKGHVQWHQVFNAADEMIGGALYIHDGNWPLTNEAIRKFEANYPGAAYSKFEEVPIGQLQPDGSFMVNFNRPNPYDGVIV